MLAACLQMVSIYLVETPVQTQRSQTTPSITLSDSSAFSVKIYLFF
jgi:hypothetical protein